MVKAQFYIISLVIAAVYLMAIAALLSPATTQPYDPLPQIFDNIQREIEGIATTSPSPAADLKAFDTFLSHQLAELNIGHTLKYNQQFNSFNLTLSSGRTAISNQFEAVK